MGLTVNKKGNSAITIDPNMRDYSKDPFILKKAEKARAFIEKHGLPKKGRAKKGK
jgi:hypothetical protein